MAHTIITKYYIKYRNVITDEEWGKEVIYKYYDKRSDAVKQAIHENDKYSINAHWVEEIKVCSNCEVILKE